jgi:hypothetical protein
VMAWWRKTRNLPVAAQVELAISLDRLSLSIWKAQDDIHY